MRENVWRVAVLLWVSLGMTVPVWADSSSPAGFWRTINEKTGQPRGIVEIFESEGVLYGRLVRSLVPGEDPEKRCVKCEGEFHNQKIVGLRFLWGFREEEGIWTGGKILDPDNGNIYRCRLSLVEGGRKLKVRGYIGIPLIGRNQIWERIASP